VIYRRRDITRQRMADTTKRLLERLEEITQALTSAENSVSGTVRRLRGQSVQQTRDRIEVCFCVSCVPFGEHFVSHCLWMTTAPGVNQETALHRGAHLSRHLSRGPRETSTQPTGGASALPPPPPSLKRYLLLFVLWFLPLIFGRRRRS
jgi:hypothetical protein